MAIARMVGQAILKSLVGQALSVGEMVRIVRAAGYGYHYTTMLSDIREYTGRLKYETQVRDLTGNQVVPDAWMNRVDMAYPYRYKVWGDVEYYDPVSGEYMTETRSIYTDDLMKKADFEGFIEGSELASEYYPEMTLTKIELRGMDINTRML